MSNLRLNIEPISAFADNYIWMLSVDDLTVAVDPGDARPVLAWLDQHRRSLTAILITHWHPDHIGGINDLLNRSAVPVYGPRAENVRIPQLTHPLDDGDRVHLDALDLNLDVMAVPGHTLGHIAYTAPGLLFCGDTLFSMGCGRLFEGTPAQMHASLTHLATLSDDTAVYCTHEYTLSNLAFARAVEPDHPGLQTEVERVKKLRAQNQPSLPTRVGHEKKLNPFLRCATTAVRQAVETHNGTVFATEVDVFTALRRWKDGFKA